MISGGSCGIIVGSIIIYSSNCVISSTRGKKIHWKIAAHKSN